MANTLTNLIPDIYAAMDVVSRELVGFIPAVARDSTADRVTINQTLRVAVSPSNAAGGNITPAMSLPSASDQTFTNKTLTISKQRFFPFSWTGEEENSMNAGGPGFLTLRQYQIAQAMRAAVNEIEADIATAASAGASRAFGTTAGTAPVLADWSGAKKILDDNGAPMSDRATVINTTAGAALRNTSALYQVNTSGDSNLLRNGTLGNLYGFDIRESAQVITPAAGTLSGASTASGALTVGQTTLTLKTTTGTGIAIAGDIITLANDANKYVVVSTNQAGANPGTGETVTIAAPGIRMAQGAAERAITTFASSTRNIAFCRNAIVLATRLPAVPTSGDLASDRMTVTDPNSGMSFEIAVYPGFRMNVYHLSACWGVSVIKSEHVAIIIG
jgi:hypothetical protein